MNAETKNVEVVESRARRNVAAITPSAEANPMQLLQIATQQGRSIEEIKEFMALAERWEARLARKAFDAAIAEAKAEIKPILKNREVDFTSAKGRTNYVYEDLAQIASDVDPILARHGLSYRYRSQQDGKRLTVTCVLSHRDGHSEDTTLYADNDETGNKNTIQSIASAATYLQRYTLKLALGLSASKDDDGRGTTKPTEPTPEGYGSWKADMEALSDEGIVKLEAAWSKSDSGFRRYVVKWDEPWWKQTKARAAEVTS